MKKNVFYIYDVDSRDTRLSANLLEVVIGLGLEVYIPNETQRRDDLIYVRLASCRRASLARVSLVSTSATRVHKNAAFPHARLSSVFFVSTLARKFSIDIHIVLLCFKITF